MDEFDWNIAWYTKRMAVLDKEDSQRRVPISQDRLWNLQWDKYLWIEQKMKLWLLGEQLVKYEALFQAMCTRFVDENGNYLCRERKKDLEHYCDECWEQAEAYDRSLAEAIRAEWDAITWEWRTNTLEMMVKKMSVDKAWVSYLAKSNGITNVNYIDQQMQSRLDKLAKSISDRRDEAIKTQRAIKDSLDAKRQTAELARKELIKCIDEKCVATLIVIKLVINDDGGTAKANDFTLRVSPDDADPRIFRGNSTEPGTIVKLHRGNYLAWEPQSPGYLVPGYSVAYSSECSGSIRVGETKKCTVTNDDIEGCGLEPGTPPPPPGSPPIPGCPGLPVLPEDEIESAFSSSTIEQERGTFEEPAVDEQQQGANFAPPSATVQQPREGTSTEESQQQQPREGTSTEESQQQQPREGTSSGT